MILLKLCGGSHGSYARLPRFRLFLQLRKVARRRISRAVAGWENAARKPSAQVLRVETHIMDEHVQKSCWGLTAKAVLGFAGIILLAWLVSGADKVAVVAAG
jgi:hypothetical protein